MARDLKIGDKEIRVRATPLTLLFYKQEFKSDFMGDMAKLEKIKDSMVNLDTTLFLQMIWAMNKSDSYPQSFPNFMDWLGSFESIDLSDTALYEVTMEEAAAGFFRGKYTPTRSK
ncbi:MAG TPA: hypothetical protein DCP90_01980 [Clostridiales bacterium]|nr:MAG: hypothetical protein A2Y22_08680 [Clostridiales bacterium GWD2_32_59]HAN09362.1 hypothetical protein [Clostridiales bacterium]